MDIAHLIRRNIEPRSDGLPSTQELLQDDRLSYLRDLTSPIYPEVDLVAVHGLNWANASAFAVRTWTSGERGEERLWLKDFLPHRLPNVRVLLYAYNSNVAFHTSSIGVGDIAEDLLHKLWTKRQSSPERPLVFVCHSLGGLVVKRAIVKARSIPRYHLIGKSAKTFAFFATPHRGGHGAAIGQKAAGIVRRAGPNPRNGILEALRKDSHLAPDIHNDFVDGEDDYHVCTFFECRPIPPLRDLIVEKSSAILGLRAEIRVPCIDEDHSTICKFAVEDESYKFVIDEIEDLVNWSVTSASGITNSKDPIKSANSLSDSLETSDSSSESSVPASNLAHHHPFSADDASAFVSSQSSTYSVRHNTLKGPHFLVPYLRNFNFVGFQGILHQLRKFSDPSNGSSSTAALCGLGGSGKSQIALEHAYWYQLNYPASSVFWLDASSPDQLCGCLEMAAAHCGLSRPDDTSTVVLERLDRWLLDRNNGHWLIIVDGANDMKITLGAADDNQLAQQGTSRPPVLSKIFGYQIPAAAHGKVLFTTNNRSLGKLLAAQEVLLEVHNLKPQDACTLIRKQLEADVPANSGAKNQGITWLDTDLEILAENLEYLPLALAQAAAYIRQNQMSVQNYLQLMMENDFEMIGLLENDFLAGNAGAHSSKAIMSTWKIGFDWIEAHHKGAAEMLSLLAFLEPRQIPLVLLDRFQPSDRQPISQLIRVLVEYSFISANSSNTVLDMHRLVQVAMRKRLSALQMEETGAIEALKLLSYQFPDVTYKTWQSSAAMLPHALKILSCTLYGPTEAIPLGILQAKIGWYYLLRGNYSQADLYCRQALDNVLFAPGVMREDVLDIKTKHVHVLQKLGRFEEAEDLAQEVWRGRRTTPGTKPEDITQSIDLLSVIYQEQGKYGDAEKVMRKVLRSLNRAFEARDIQVILSKRRLGTILHYIGRYKEAEQFLREAIDGFSKCDDDHYLALLKTRWRLAWVLHSQGRYKEAEEIDLEVWKLQLNILGPSHPDTLISLYGLSNDLQAQHRYSEAEAHKRDIYRQACAILGKTHIYTLFAASSLASCLVVSNVAVGKQVSEQLAEAEDLYLIVLTGMDHNLRADHPSTLAARTDLAIVRRLRSSAQLGDIEMHERETLEKVKKSLGKQHPLTLKSRDNLSRILWEQKDIKAKGNEALKQAKKVLALREKVLGWSQEDTRLTAKLVVDMLPPGKERTGLMQKIEAARSVVLDNDENASKGDDDL